MIGISRKYLILLFSFCVIINANAQEPRAIAQTDSDCFITKWAMDAGVEFTLPTTGDGYNFIINWGDGSPLEALAGSGPFTHTYAATGTFTLKISGTFPQIYCNDYYYTSKDNNENPDAIRLLSVDQWGPIVWRDMEKAFAGCAKMRINASDAPNLLQVNSMESMFNGCAVMNDPIGHWNVSSVTNMRYMLFEAKAFNQPMNDWDVSEVTNMEEMFYYCAKFNQPLNKWNVAKVTDMSDMFYRCSVFNQDIGDWDVSNVTDMNQMFYYARKFNQDIGRWNVGKVTSFRGMFYYVANFNQDIGNWDVRSANTMHSMFFRTTAFDQDLSRWQIPNLTTALSMFNYVTLSIANYDALLKSWAEQVQAGTAQKNVRFHGGESQYCQGEAARTFLIENGWESNKNQGDIIDGGKVSTHLTNVTISAPGVFQEEKGNIELLHTKSSEQYYATTTPEELNTNKVAGSQSGAINLISPALTETTEFTLWVENNDCATPFNETITINVYPKADIVNSTVELLTVGANPVADGVTEHKVKVTVYDINGNLLPNAEVLLMPVDGVDIVSNRLRTDANGEVIFVLTSTVAGTYSTSIFLFTENPEKNVTKNWGKVSTKVDYTFAADAPNIDKSSVELLTSANVILADGQHKHIFKVTLRDANDNPVPNYGVLFDPTLANAGADKVSFSTLSGTVFGAGEATAGLETNERGELIVYATATKAWVDFETVVSFGNGASNVLFNESPITYQFVAGGPNFDNSTITAVPTSQTVGETVALTIAIKDIYGNPCRGQEVIVKQATLGTELTNLVTYDGVVSSAIGTVDANGEFIVNAVSEAVGTYTSRATIMLEGVPGVKSKTVDYSFTAGEPDVNNSYVKLSVNNAEANETNRNWLSVFAFDEYGNIAPGKNVQIAATPNVSWGSGYNTAHTAITNSKGIAELTAVSAVAGTYSSEVKIEVEGTYQTISSQTGYESPRVNPVVYTFLPGAPSNLTSTISLQNSPTIANGVDEVTIKVEIKDESNNAVSDAVVVFHKTEHISGNIQEGYIYVAEGISDTGHDADGNLYVATNADGIVEIAGVSTVAGRYTTNVTLEKDVNGNFPVIGRAYYVFNPGLADASKSDVSVLVDNSKAGEENKLRVTLFDAFDNQVGTYDTNGNFSTAVREPKQITFAATTNVAINGNATSGEYIHTLNIGDASVFDVPLYSTIAQQYSTQVVLKMLDENNEVIQNPISGGNPSKYTFVPNDVSLIQSSVEIVTNGSLVGDNNKLKVSIKDDYNNPIEGVLIYLSATPGVDFGTGIGNPKVTTTQANGEVLLNISGTEAGLYKTIITFSIDGAFPESQQITNGGKPAIYYFTDSYTVVDETAGLAVRAKWAVLEEKQRGSLTEPELFVATGAKAWDFNSGQIYTAEDAEFTMEGFSSIQSGEGTGANKVSFTLNTGTSSLMQDDIVVSFVDQETQWDETKELAIRAISYVLGENQLVDYDETHAKTDGKVTAWSLSDWSKNDLSSQITTSSLSNIIAGISGEHPLTFTVTDEVSTLPNTITVTIVGNEEWFVTTWETTTANETITIPTVGGGYNFAVDWGDDSCIEEFEGYVLASHQYATAGVYVVRISGIFPRIYFDNGYEGQDITKIKSIEQWGTIEWTSMMNAFKGCSNLVIGDTVTSVPNLSKLTTLENMFRGCGKINSASLTNWDVSTIENMAGMFQGALLFNQPLSWDVSNVRNMERMFQDAKQFNQDLNNWGQNTGQVSNMSGMFNRAAGFNQNLRDWSISSLVNAVNIFDYTGLSIENYDSTLIAWNVQVEADVNTSAVPFSAVNIQYCEGTSARENLIANGWGNGTTINDGGQFCPEAFITTWNVVAGETITIPTMGEGYNFKIKWGDGSPVEHLVDGDAFSHLYSEAGVYTVEIFPNVDADGDQLKESGFPRIYFNNAEGKDKILTIEQWGDIWWEAMGNAFYGCSNLRLNASDTPNLSGVESLSQMFRACSSLNSSLNDWNVSEVINMSGMFRSASLFNQDLSNWDVSLVRDMGAMFKEAEAFNGSLEGWTVGSVTIMSQMFDSSLAFDQDISSWDISSLTDASNMLDNSGMSTENYDALLLEWNAQVEAGANTKAVPFSALGVKYCEGEESRLNLIGNGWGDGIDIQDGGSACPDPFITTWNIAGGDVITIPTVGTGYNFSIDWGDGSPLEHLSDGDVFSHTYSIANPSCTIKIEGNFPRIYFTESSDKDKILTIEQWGDIRWESMAGAFNGCSNLEKINATDAPYLLRANSMAHMFAGCTKMLAPHPLNWDVSNITNMTYAFFEAAAFNRDLNTWDVGKVEDMSYTFRGATNFNGDISSWNVSSVTTMRSMFREASSFNQDISSWDVSQVTSMRTMFLGASSFNQDINYDEATGSWNVAKVEDMSYMFQDATSFDGNISNWNVGNVRDMGNMFQGATSFNQDISLWDVSKVNSMQAMFREASAFNQDINYNAEAGSWNVSGVVDMSYMFYKASSFNGNIQNWNTEAVTNMREMFREATVFNQNISDWNVGAVQDMLGMFLKAEFFNQNIGSWNMSSVTDVRNMFNNAYAFNKDIGAWATSLKVNSLYGMFSNATSFNQDLSDWDVSEVTDMRYTFNNATSFNQDLSGWNIPLLANALNMLDKSGMSLENYDALLAEWSRQAEEGINTNAVPFSAVGVKYCEGELARETLIGKGWGDGIEGDQSGAFTDINDAGVGCWITINYYDKYHNKVVSPSSDTKKYTELTSSFTLPQLGEFNHDTHAGWSLYLSPSDLNGVSASVASDGSELKTLMSTESISENNINLYAFWQGEGVGEPIVSINDVCEIHYLKEEGSAELYGKAYINKTAKTYLLEATETGKLFNNWTTGDATTDASIFGSEGARQYIKANSVGDAVEELKLYATWHDFEGGADCEYYTITYLTAENGTVYDFADATGVVYYYQARKATALPAVTSWSLTPGGAKFTIDRFTQGNLILYPISE